MNFEQRQKNAQRQKLSLSPEQINFLKYFVKSGQQIENELYLETITDLLPEVEIQNYGDDEGVPDVDEDGKLNEDINWDEYCPDDNIVRPRRKVDTKSLPFDEKNFPDSSKSLKYYLLEQLRLSGMNVVQKEIAFCLIDNIDNDGYLKPSIEDLRQEEGRYEIETWYETLRLLKQFDPPGVAAKDLSECILIQARSKNYQNIDLLEAIIDKHWIDVENKDYAIIAKSLSIDVRDVVRALEYVSKLNPNPGQQYNQTVQIEDKEDGKISFRIDVSAFQIRPDYKIIREGDGYIIDPEYEYADIPALISSFYHDKLKTGDSSYPERLENDEISYVKGVRKKVPEHLRRGDKTEPLSVNEIKNLSKMLEKSQKWIERLFTRHRDVVKVIMSVVKFQKDYLDTGDLTTLKPLKAQDIADDINDESIDDSKVRRIRKNKYIDTRIGAIKLEDFFDQEGFETTSGQKMASKAVKELLKKFVKSEKKIKPYSDQEITDYLTQNFGIKIDRRTVSKYRKSLGILSSSERKWRL